MINRHELAKIILSQVLAILSSILLVNYVFFPGEARVRENFKTSLYNSPKTIVRTIKNTPNLLRLKVDQIAYLLTGHTLKAVPPPWTMPDTSYPYPPGENGQRGNIPTVPPIYQPTSPSQPTTLSQQPTTYPTSPEAPQDKEPTQPPPQPPQATLPPQPATITPLPPGNTLTSEEQGTVDEINRRRQEMGLSTLSVNQQLVSAARRHSKDMSQNGFCGHTGSDGSSPPKRASEAGFSGSFYGETVACGYSSPQQVVDAWWKSSGHKAILTNNRITLIGLGWWSGPNRTTAVVGY